MLKRRDFIRLGAATFVGASLTLSCPFVSSRGVITKETKSKGTTQASSEGIKLIAEAWQQRRYEPPASVIQSTVKPSERNTPNNWRAAIQSAIRENYLNGDTLDVEGFCISKVEAALLLSAV